MFQTFKRLNDLTLRKKLQCNHCKRETIHSLEARCTGEWSEEHPVGGHIYGGTHFSLFRCGACDDVCFETDSWDCNLFDHDVEGNTYLIHECAQFPPPSSADFSFDTTFIPNALGEHIDELMYALAGGKLNLATTGLRVVIDFIVRDVKCSGRDLKQRIDALCADHAIDDQQKDLLHKIRLKGNASAHEGIAMRKEEMVAGLNIISLLLERLYNEPARKADVIAKAQKAFGGTPDTAADLKTKGAD